MADPVPAAPAQPAAPAPAVPAAPAAPAAPASPAPVAGAVPSVAPAPGVTPAAQPAAPATPEPPKPGAPAAAELAIKLPDGVQIDAAVLDGFKSIAKEHGLTQKQAQALVDFQLKRTQEQQANADKVYGEALQKQRVQDLEQVKADPKLGGANFDTTVREYRAAVQKFGGEELKKMLESSGYDCHPAVVRTFVAIAKAVAEDGTAGRVGQQHTDAVTERKPMSQTERVAARYSRKTAPAQ